MPSDAITQKDMHILFSSIVLDALGLPADDYASVRVDYAENGQPGFSREENVTFVLANLATSPCTTVHDATSEKVGWGTLDEKIKSLRHWRVSITTYGPDSLANACAVRDYIAFGRAEAALVGAKLGLLTDVPYPSRNPEGWEQGGFYDRSDFVVQVYELVNTDYAANSIEVVDIKVIDSEETLADIQVEVQE